MPRLRQRRMNSPLAVVGDQGAMVVAQDVGVGPLHAHGDARQPHALQRPQRLRRQQVGARSMENWIFRGKRPICSAKLEHLRAVQAEERIAKLERAETPAADVLPHLLGHRFRAANAGRVVQHDVGTIVALHRAAAAGLDQRRGKPRKVVADAEPPRPKRRPVGQRQAVEVLQACPTAPPSPGRASTSSSFHSNCSASPLTTVTPRSPKNSGSTEAAVPTTSTRAAGSRVQQSGHHVALQRERQQRRIEDVQIGAGRKPVLGILDAVSEAGEDRRQVGKQRRHRPAVAGVKRSESHGCGACRRRCIGRCRNRRRNPSRRHSFAYPRERCAWEEEGLGIGD